MSEKIPRELIGLGAYMRAIGSKLTALNPMTAKDAQLLIPQDEGYASAVLIRLRERNIAYEYPMGHFTRGASWAIAAKYYKWKGTDDETDASNKNETTS